MAGTWGPGAAAAPGWARGRRRLRCCSRGAASALAWAPGSAPRSRSQGGCECATADGGAAELRPVRSGRQSFCRPRADLAPLPLSPPAPRLPPLSPCCPPPSFSLYRPPPMRSLRRHHVSPSYSLRVSASPVATFQEQRGHLVAVLCAPSPLPPSPPPRRSARWLGSGQRAPAPNTPALVRWRGSRGAVGPLWVLCGRGARGEGGRPPSGATSGKPEGAKWGSYGPLLTFPCLPPSLFKF